MREYHSGIIIGLGFGLLLAKIPLKYGLLSTRYDEVSLVAALLVLIGLHFARRAREIKNVAETDKTSS